MFESWIFAGFRSVVPRAIFDEEKKWSLVKALSTASSNPVERNVDRPDKSVAKVDPTPVKLMAPVPLTSHKVNAENQW
jgi:hypothetical protein